jgi:adenosylcobinamide-phosphate synthase
MAGLIIAVLVVGGAGSVGWVMERLTLWSAWIGIPLMAIALASCLAVRSLENAVLDVLRALPDLPLARSRLAWIVGRDVTAMKKGEILRAAAETASENAVDGVFAPLFWMIVGMAIWTVHSDLPGPLALAWGFKAASTLDSMLGYRSGTLRWLGTAGAKLDDVLTWIPCRLTVLSLPMAAGKWRNMLGLYAAARREGAADPSPNAGLSQAIYAQVVGIRLGGVNRYGCEVREKPILAGSCPPPNEASVKKILKLTMRLETIWLAVACLVLYVLDSNFQ